MLGLVGIVVALAPAVLARSRTASPRLLAGTHLLSLAGLALLPAAAVVCTLVRLACLPHGPPTGRAGCGAASCGGIGAWAPAALGLAALAPLAWQAVRLLAAAQRSTPTTAALAGARPRRTAGGTVVWVLPAAQPAAHTCGLRHPHAIVTRGLLDLLNADEQQAVCEHEAAHLRLGHPRLLLAGATIARAYGVLPGVQRTFSGLRRELEAAADDAAATVVGTAPLLSALARVGLTRTASPAGPGTAAAEFADPDHLRYRLHRLQHPTPPDRRTDTLLMAAGIALIAVFTWVACTLATGTPAVGGVAVCASTLAALALRPLWPPQHRQPAERHPTDTVR